AGLAPGVGCGPWPGQAEPPAKVHTVGFLAPYGAALRDSPSEPALSDALAELGFVAGQNLRIESRFAEYQPARLPVLAAELVNLPVEVLVASGTAVTVARDATSTIPIVMINQPNPVQAGLIASLARPGGNLTGPTLGEQLELNGKRLQLLKETLPELSSVAVLGYPDLPGDAELWRGDVGQTLGLRLIAMRVARSDDLE